MKLPHAMIPHVAHFPVRSTSRPNDVRQHGHMFKTWLFAFVRTRHGEVDQGWSQSAFTMNLKLAEVLLCDYLEGPPVLLPAFCKSGTSLRHARSHRCIIVHRRPPNIISQLSTNDYIFDVDAHL
jgi:hypothetical protein